MEYFDKAKEYYDKALKAVSKTDTEKKLSEALSKENWGASTTLLREIAQLTFNWQEYGVVMRELWNTINSSSKNWRQKFKGLTLLEYLIKNGTERVVEEARENLYAVKVLTSYSNYVDGVEKGAGVREKAKQIIELLNDNDLVREEREKAHALRDKYTGIGRDGATHGSSFNGGAYDSGGGRYGRESRFQEEKPWDKGFGSKPTKYRDEPSEKSKSSKSGNLTGSESEGESAPRRRRHKEKKKKSKKSKSKKSSKEDTDFGNFTAAKTEEVDLFGADDTATNNAQDEIFDPFGNSNASGNAQGSDEWAAFTSAPTTTPAATEPAVGEFGDFGDFSSAQPAPAVAQQQEVNFFDSPVPQQPAVQQTHNNNLMGEFQMTSGGNDLLGSPQQQPMAAQPPMQQAPMGGDGDLLGGDLLAPAQPIAQQQQQQNVMGSFQMAPSQPQSHATTNILDSSIIDLDNLSLNSSKPKAPISSSGTPNRNQNHASTSQQPMNMMGGMQQPMNMMGGSPMGMQQPMMNQPSGMQQPMNMMGGMQQPMSMMGGSPMQQSMGMQQPMMNQPSGMQQPMNMMGGNTMQQPMGMQQPMMNQPSGMQQPMNMMAGMNMMGNQQGTQQKQQSPF